jgi:hypothetical protein
VVNVVSGLGDVGDAIVRHHLVEKVTMTGSAATAKLIQRSAAETLTPTWMPPPSASPSRRCTPSMPARHASPAPAFWWSARYSTR